MEGDVAPARRLVLALICALCICQAFTWNFYGPISAEVMRLQGWTLNEIAWLENTANVTMLVGLPLVACYADKHGLRSATLVSTALIAACAVLRCLGSMVFQAHEYNLAALAMALNGFGAAWSMSAPPLISAAWFPPQERGVATAATAVSPYVGQSVGFLWGPWAVRAGEGAMLALRRLYLWQAALCLALLVAVAQLFESAPARPPSSSAAPINAAPCSAPAPPVRQRTLRRLALVAAVAALPSGVYGGWVPVLAPNLAEFGVTEAGAAWLGFLMTLLAAAGGLIFGRLLDHFPGQAKEALVACLAAAGLGFLWFALAASGAVPSSAAILAVSGAVGAFFANATWPLGFELAMETAYPEVPGTHAAAGLTVVQTLVQIVFLAASFLPTGSGVQGSLWMNWLNALVGLALVPPLLAFRAEYPRLVVDGVLEVT